VAILGFFVAQQLISIYEISWRVASVVMVFQGAVRTVIFPQISDWNANDNIERIESLLEQALIPSLLFAIPALAGGVLVGADMLSIIYGNEFRAGYIVLVIFLTEKIFRSVHLTLSPTLFAIDKPQFGYRGSIISIVANCILNLVLVPLLGISGAAIATTLSSIIGAGVNVIYLSKFVSIKIPMKSLQWMIGSSTIMIIAIVVIKIFWVIDGLIKLGLVVFIGVAVYSFCILGYTPIRTEIRKFIPILDR
jgi:O-antigen/teichoic acid export membrane protein